MKLVSNFRHYLQVLYAWRISKRQRLGYAPIEVAIEATNVCNFRCSFCPQSDPAHHDIVPRSYLSPGDAGIIMAKMRRGGVRTDTMHWSVDGEPFMHKQFVELCRVAIDHAFTNMYFSTNGLLASVKRLRELPAEARYTLAVDFSGDEAYFEDVRGSKGSWRRILDNLQGILADPDLSHIKLDIAEIASYSMDDADAREKSFAALQAVLPQSPRLRIRRKTFHNATGLVDNPKAAGRMATANNICPYPWTSMMVCSNGDVVACCRDLRHLTVLGNLLHSDFDDVWNSAEALRLRANLAAHTPELSAACNGCDMPFAQDKFTITNLAKTAIGRLQVFS